MTAYREGLVEKILSTAMPLFKEKGIKAVKMDDIARELGISKRTLYEIYNTKEDLLIECLHHHSDYMVNQITEYSTHEDNQMKIITFAIKSRLSDLTSTSHQYFLDIEKYPQIRSLMEKNKERLANKSSDFIQKCVEQGYFRRDINYNIFHKIGDAVLEYIMKNRIYREFSWSEIFNTFIKIHLSGCCTEKGHKYLKDIIDELEE